MVVKEIDFLYELLDARHPVNVLVTFSRHFWGFSKKSEDFQIETIFNFL